MIHLLGEWSFPPVPFIGIVLGAIVYLRGFVFARRTRPHQFPAWRALCFFSGLATLWLALASPIDALDDYLLAVHMIQHFILMSVAPPLIVLGAPTVPILRGLPRPLVRAVVGPLLRNRAFHAALRFLTHPITAWLLMNVAYLGWHIPAMFELTFRSDPIHDFEHFCFFSTSLLFWWIVLAPWPSRPRWPRWTVIPYLLSADVVNTVLSAILVFSTTRPLSELRRRPAHLLPHAAKRSGRRRRRDVGAEFAGDARACRLRHHAVAHAPCPPSRSRRSALARTPKRPVTDARPKWRAFCYLQGCQSRTPWIPAPPCTEELYYVRFVAPALRLRCNCGIRGILPSLQASLPLHHPVLHQHAHPGKLLCLRQHRRSRAYAHRGSSSGPQHDRLSIHGLLRGRRRRRLLRGHALRQAGPAPGKPLLLHAGAGGRHHRGPRPLRVAARRRAIDLRRRVGNSDRGPERHHQPLV